MWRYWKQSFNHLVLVSAICLSCLPAALAKPPGGGGGGGAAAIVDPAFVYLDDADGGLFLTTSDGGTKVRLTRNAVTRDLGATWSPDFDRATPGHQGMIAFFRQRDSRYIWGDLCVVPSDASGPPVLIRSFTDFTAPPPERPESLSWSPDGSRIIYAAQGAVWSVTVAGGALVRLFSTADYDVRGSSYYVDNPTFSPDLETTDGYQGMIAFTSGEYFYETDVWSGADTFLCPVEIDTAGTLTVFAEETINLTQSPDVIEEHPVWSGDGEYLAFSRRIDGADLTSDGRGISVLQVSTGFQWDVVDTYKTQIRPTWSPDSLLIGYSDARLVGGKGTGDVFFVSPWDNSPPVNVTKTDSSRAVEIYPEWNPAWINDVR